MPLEADCAGRMFLWSGWGLRPLLRRMGDARLESPLPLPLRQPQRCLPGSWHLRGQKAKPPVSAWADGFAVFGPLSYADYTIRGLRKKSGYEDDLSLMMIVKDQAGQTVLSLPFFPGC